MQQTHVIKEFALTIQVPNEWAAQRVQARWLRPMEEVLLETLEETCDRYVHSDEVVFIDQLTLDLGTFSNEGFDATDFKSRFQLALEQQLVLFGKKSLNQIAVSTMPSGDLGAHSNTASNFIAARGVFIHFLEKGNLPWWQAAVEFEFSTIVNQWLEEDSLELKRQLVRLAKEQPIALFRLLDNLTLDVFHKILTQYTWEEAIRFASKKLDWAFPENQMSALPFSLEQKTLFAFHLSKEISLDTLNSGSANSLFQALVQFTIQFNLPRPNSLPINENPIPPNTAESIVLALPSQLKESAIGGLMVSHAGGIVLLAGFLNHAFAKLGWIENHQFVNEASRLKAIYWLKYLNTGQEVHPEYLYTLEKVICGLPPTEYLPPLEHAFSDQEIEEATEVLESLRHHWPAVHKTSIENLRQTFLERQGILRINEEGNWILQIEQGTYDVLLNLLPPQISLSMIVLPWLNYFIYVEWSQR